MKRLLVWLALVAVNGGWEAQFEPHPSNVAIVFGTVCHDAGKDVFWAVNRRELEPGASSVWIREPDVPGNTSCEMQAYRIVNTTPDDPTAEVAVERMFVAFER